MRGFPTRQPMLSFFLTNDLANDKTNDVEAVTLLIRMCLTFASWDQTGALFSAFPRRRRHAQDAQRE